eukprot:scaffold4504_cov116-Isochrysis_galbana.AAC.11
MDRIDACARARPARRASNHERAHGTKTRKNNKSLSSSKKPRVHTAHRTPQPRHEHDKAQAPDPGRGRRKGKGKARNGAAARRAVRTRLASRGHSARHAGRQYTAVAIPHAPERGMRRPPRNGPPPSEHEV